MKSPFSGKDMLIHKELRVMFFRKEEFDIVFHYYLCEDTGEWFEDDLLSQLNYNQLVNQYREKYTIPFPEQICAIREKYELSAAKMSELLGFGTNGYRLYEGGEVPSLSNARLIQMIEDPQEFRKMVEVCVSLNEVAKMKICRRIDALAENQRLSSFTKQLEEYFLNVIHPGRMTGYKMPNLEKLTEMIVYFSEHMQPWKTKMNKLLFYSDFLMHKQSGFSISGLQYRAIPMGPVPNNFNSIFEYLTNNNHIDLRYSSFSNGTYGEQFLPHDNRKFHAELFAAEELSVLEKVADRFLKTTTIEMVEISHQERAWIENKDKNKLIDYSYSFDLNVF